MPYFEIEGASIYDRLREPGFHLVRFSDGEGVQKNDEWSADAAPWVSCRQVPLYPHVAEIFGTEKGFDVLLRPDNYIATISADQSLAPIKSYLERCL
jgi:hypothetical protein